MKSLINLPIFIIILGQSQQFLIQLQRKMSIFSSVKKGYQPIKKSTFKNSSSTSIEDSILFSNLQDAGSYLQSSALKMKDCLAINECDLSRSLAYSQSNCESNQDHPERVKLVKAKQEFKIPIMKGPEGELKRRVKNLGLEKVMKELIAMPKKRQISELKVIKILNQTYIDDKLYFKRQGMVPKMGRKSTRSARKKETSTVFVNWDPETIEREIQFKSVLNFVPNQMFPSRNNQTRLLKSRQKNRKNYVSAEQYRPQFTEQQMLSSSAGMQNKQKRMPPYSVRVPSYSARPHSSNFDRQSGRLKNQMGGKQPRVRSARESIDHSSQRRQNYANKLIGQKPYPQTENLIQTKKVKIYN